MSNGDRVYVQVVGGMNNFCRVYVQGDKCMSNRVGGITKGIVYVERGSGI